MTTKTKRKCMICDERPATVGFYCHNCKSHIDAEIRKAHTRAKAPDRFITYQGKVVEMYNLGDGQGKYQYSKRDPVKLPKAKTVDLNIYLPDFTRDEIKRLKRIVLSICERVENPHVQYMKEAA